MQIAGAVILYYPNEEEIIRNIKSYIHYLNTLIVYDNSNCSREFISKIESISSKIVFVTNNTNEGIAKPLNRTLELVNTEWILTMDQDSYFERTHAAAYFKSFIQLFSQSEEVAVVCPNHSLQSAKVIISEEYKEVVHAITSGSLINTEICRQLNGFEEKLFIDDVDFEYCYRCVIAGYKIVQFSNIYLNHSLGTQREVGYFSVFKKSERSIHSPFRIYYMVRNFLFVSAKYKKKLPEEMKRRRKQLVVILKNNLLFSGKFLKVLAAAIRGYLHFKMNRFS